MTRPVDAPALVQCFPDVGTARRPDVDVIRSRLPEQVRNVYQSPQTMVPDIIRHQNGNARTDEVRFRKTGHFWDRSDGGYYRASYYFLSDRMVPLPPGLDDPVSAAKTSSMKTLWMPETASMSVSDSASYRQPDGIRHALCRWLALPLHLWRKMWCCFGGATRISDAARDGLSCASTGSLDSSHRAAMGCPPEAVSSESSDSGIAVSSWLPPMTMRDSGKRLSAGACHSADSLLSLSAQRQPQYAQAMHKRQQNVPVSEFAENPADSLLSRFTQRQQAARFLRSEMPVQQHRKHPQVQVSEFAVNPPDSLLLRFTQRQRQNAHHRTGRDMPSVPAADKPETDPRQQADAGEIVKITLWANNGRMAPPARSVARIT
jgi:hypothetical protein